MVVSGNMSQFYIENKENQFLSLVGFFSSTMEMNGSKQHPIVPFTLSTRFKDLVLTLVIYHTTLLRYCKIPNISPGLIEMRKHFLGGLIFGGHFVLVSEYQDHKIDCYILLLQASKAFL